jgi:hypothetical protein
MKAISRLSPPSPDAPVAVIRCVIIYENSEAGKAGKRFCERLAAEAGRNCASSCELWNFRVLGIRAVRNEAASAALDADVVVFAMSDVTQFPPEVEEWIELWLWLNENGRPAVVALSTSAAAETRTFSRLQSAARRNGFPFFSHIAAAPSGRLPIREQAMQVVNAQNLRSSRLCLNE